MAAESGGVAMTASTVTKIGNAPVAPHLQPPVILPPGETELSYISHHLEKQFGRCVITIWFAAVDYGGVAIPRYYSVKMRGNKSFVAPRGGDLVADFRRIFSGRIQRLDRFPLHWLEGAALIGEIGTVVKNANQKTRDDGTEYSVVRKLTQCL